MQNRIAYYIVSLLYLNGKVRIPGIGKITHYYEPASVGDADESVTPPQARGQFIAEKHTKNRLLEKFVAYQTHVSRTKARREIARFTNQVQSGIKNDGKVDLKYLGTFSIQDDTIQFSPNDEILNPGHSALHKITLPVKILSMEEEESVPYAAKDSTFHEMGSVVLDYGTSPLEETSFEEPTYTEVSHAPAMTLESEAPLQSEGSIGSSEPIAFVPVVMDEVINPPLNIHVSTPIQEKPEAPVTPEPVVYSTPERSLQKNQGAVRTVPPKEVSKRREIPLAVPLAAMIMIGLLIGAFLFYQSRTSHPESAIIIDSTLTDDHDQTLITSGESNTKDDIAQENDEADTKIALADTGTHEEGEATTTPTPETIIPESVTPASTEQDESLHVATGDCTVVLGAFSLESNADRMVSRLQSMGYTAQTQPRGQLTQVGVPVDCKAQNLKVVLDFLRKNVEPHAWVLRPS